MFMVALFSTSQRWRQPRCSSDDEQKDKTRVLHTTECCGSDRGCHVGNLENMVLGERTQSQNTAYPMIAPISSVQRRQIHRDRKWVRARQRLGEQRMATKGSERVSVWGDKRGSRQR